MKKMLNFITRISIFRFFILFSLFFTSAYQTPAFAIDGCGVNADADVVIMLDRTYSVSSDTELAYQRAAAKTLLNYFQSATTKPRVSVGWFSGPDAKVAISLTSDYNAVSSTIDAMTTSAGNTDLSVGINTAQTEISTKAINPRSRYIIVFSDGVVNRPVCQATECGCPDAYNAAFNAAQSARNANTQIFAVRFGDTGSCTKQTAMNFMKDSIASVPHFFFEAADNGSNLNSILTTISGIIACEGPFSVGGLITKNNIALPGMVTNLTGDMTKSATTGSDGRYLLDFIPYGTHYTVTPSGPGCTFAPSSRSGTLVENVSDANFAATGSTCGGTFTVSGFVKTNKGPVSDAVVSSGFGTTTTTNGSGQYMFVNVPFGTSYSLAATKNGYSFSPGASGVVSSNVESDINGTEDSVIPEGCTQSLINDDKVLIDDGIVKLNAIGQNALGWLEKDSKKMLKSKKTKNRAAAKRGLRSVNQARAKIKKWYAQNLALIVSYPNVILDCPNVPPQCIKNDYSNDIAIFIKNANGIFKEVNRLITRHGFINRPIRDRSRIIALREQAKNELFRLIEIANTVPTQTSVCTTGNGS